MKITQPSTHLKQISFGGSVFPLNCYLVQDEDGYTLIDTGLGFLSGSLIKVIREHGTPLRRIVITHGHMDHADGINAVQAAFPEAKLCVGQREYLLMTGDRRTVPGESGSRIGGSFYQLKSKPHRLLATGDRVGSLEVLNAAGHSPGQIALRDERDGTLLAADAFHTVGGLTPVTQFRFRFPWPYFANWNSTIAQATADRLLSLEISRIAPGHGPVLEISDASVQSVKLEYALEHELIGSDPSRLLKNSTFLVRRLQGADFFVPRMVGETKSALRPCSFSDDFVALGASFGVFRRFAAWPCAIS